MMTFALFDDEIPAPGETQIRTDGLHISSYANDGERIPYLSTSAEEVLGQALRDKHRFENSPGCWQRKITLEEPVAEASNVVYKPAVEPMPITRPSEPEPPRKLLPSPAPDLEEHTAGLSELADLAAYVAARSSRSGQTPPFVPPVAVTRLATAVASEGTPEWLIDTDNRKSSSEPTEYTGLTEPISANLAINVHSLVLTSLTAPEAQSALSVSNALAVPGHHRKSPVRLTDKERETATRLGLKSSITAPKHLAHSVLDDFEPIKRSAKQSYGPSKNVLIQCIAAQDERCAYCDRLFGALVIIDGKLITLTAELDHFIPRAKRLNNSPSNIVAACQICNGLKSSRVFTSMTQARAVLQAAWAERGWTDMPLPLPNASRLTSAAPYFLAFRVAMPTCFN
jgi:5-methylcytosine-specific restriction endonuclease McrA